MAEIVQHLGFEASAAISTLNTLQKALGGVNRQLRAMNKETAKSQPTRIAGFNEAAQQALNAQNALDKLKPAFDNAGKSGKKAGQDITLSWETMARVVQTQVILRSIGLLTEAFTTSASAAHDFQIQIAQISALASGPGADIDSLSSSVANLSVELGRSVGETGTALFETVQNDISDTVAGAEDFVRVASKLAITFGGELNDSVNALTSVLKVYNLEVDDATDVGDAFAVAIDKGRIKLEDLANSLGTVLPLAKPLGLGFAESSAAIAALTQSGLNSSTAMTQLRNILQKLVVPTEDLQAAFTRLGVTSGAELIKKTGNLGNALKALQSSVGGNDQALAAMFGTIRGQLGVFNLLSNDASIFNDILAASEDRYGKLEAAAEKVDGTEARRADKEWAAFNRTLLEVGDTTLKLQTDFISMFNDFIPSGETAIRVVTSLSVAMAVLAARAAATSVALRAAFVAAGPAALVFATVAVWTDVILKVAQYVKSVDNATEAVKRLTDAERNFQQSAITATAARETAELEDEWAIRESFSEDYFDEVNKMYNAHAAVAVKANQRISDSLQGTLGEMVEFYETAIKDIEKQLNGVGETSKQALDHADDIADRINEINKEQNRNPNMDARQKEWLDLEESVQKAEQAVRDFAKASTEAERERARDRFGDATDEIKKLGDDSADNARGRQIRQKEQELLLEMQRIQQAGDAKRQAAIQEYGATAQRVFTDLVNNAKVLEERLPGLLSRTNADGSFKTQEQLDKDLADAKALADGYNQVQKAASELPLSELGLRQRFEELGTRVQEGVKKVRLDSEAIANDLEAKLRAKNLSVQVTPTGNAQVDNLIKDIDDQFAAGANPADQLKAQLEAAKGLVAEQAAYNTATAQAKGLIASNTAALKAQQENIQAASNELTAKTLLGGTDGEAAVESGFADQLRAAQDALDKLSKLDVSKAGESELAAIQTEAEQLKTTIAEIKEGAGLSDFTVETANTVVDTVLENVEARKTEISNIPLISEETKNAALSVVSEIQTKMANIGLQAGTAQGIGDAASGMGTLATNAGTAATNTQGISNTIASSVIPAINAAIGRMNALAEAARAAAAAAAAAASAGGGGNAYFGKQVQYRAMGGPTTRGHDKQLVAMDPHEMIVNARQSRNFAAELHSINAGQRPQFREQGGNVSISIGDVNVNGTNIQNPAQTGRDIVKSVRREMRLETSRINRGK